MSAIYLFSFHSNGNIQESSLEVVKLWKDDQGSEATMENLESLLKGIGREDIVKDFKYLANSNYGSKDRVIVTEIRRSGNKDPVFNGVQNGDNNLVIDSSVEEKRFSGYHEDSTRLPEEGPTVNGNSDEKEDVIGGMFSDNEEILKFFQDNVTNDETEIN